MVINLEGYQVELVTNLELEPLLSSHVVPSCLPWKHVLNEEGVSIMATGKLEDESASKMSERLRYEVIEWSSYSAGYHPR